MDVKMDQVNTIFSLCEVYIALVMLSSLLGNQIGMTLENEIDSICIRNKQQSHM